MRSIPLLKLLIPLLVGVVVSVAIMVFSELSHRRLTDANIAITRSLEVHAATNELFTMVIDAETSQRGYLLTGRTEYLEPYVSALPKIEAKFGQLRDLVASDPEQRERLGKLNNLIGRKLGEIEATLELYRQQGAASAQELVKTELGRKTMDEIRAQIRALENAERGVLLDRTFRWRSDVEFSRLGLALITAFNLVLLLLVFMLAARALARREREQRNLVEQQRQLEEQVRERTAELSELSINLQNVQEAEKSKLARDIHDELGSILVSAKMDLSWVRNRVKGDPAVGDRLNRALGLLDDGVEIKRRIIEDLRPTLLDNLGLGAAINWHVNHACDRGDLRCEISVPEEEPNLPSNVAIALFRIVQEALTNVLRYAKAKTAWITLTPVPGGVTLQIRDDGVGIASEAQHNRLSHGIVGMRQRILAVGGEFKIEGTPGGGTTIHIFVPLLEGVVAPVASGLANELVSEERTGAGRAG